MRIIYYLAVIILVSFLEGEKKTLNFSLFSYRK